MNIKPDSTDIILGKTLRTTYMFDEHYKLLDRNKAASNSLIWARQAICKVEEDCDGRTVNKIPTDFIERLDELIREYRTVVVDREGEWTNTYDEFVPLSGNKE